MFNMPGALEIISGLAYWTGAPAVAAVLVTASLLVIAEDRRLLVFALATQYLFVGLLYTHLLALPIAGIKIMAGLIVWIIVFLSAQQGGWQPVLTGSGTPGLWGLGAGARFRVFAVILVVLIGWKLATSGVMPFPVASEYVTFGALQLACQGLLMLGLTGRPLKTGLGILTFLSGFGLLYSGVEPALMVVGVLAAVDVAVALAISYLISADVTSGRFAHGVKR